MFGSGLQGPAVRQPYLQPVCFCAWDSLNTARRNTVYVYLFVWKWGKSNSASEKEFMCESRRQQVTNKITERLPGGWGDAFSAPSGDPKKHTVPSSQLVSALLNAVCSLVPAWWHTLCCFITSRKFSRCPANANSNKKCSGHLALAKLLWVLLVLGNLFKPP